MFQDKLYQIGKMKKEIDTQEYAKFQKDSTIFTVLFIALLIVPVPLVMLWKWFGMALYLCLFGIGMYFAVRIEKYKKKYDIQTFKEIVAFTDGKSLDEIEKAREEGIKVGLIRPITLWPFPSESYAKYADKVKGFLCVEMSTGQMVEDVRLAVNGRNTVDFYGRTGGNVPSQSAILEEVRKIAAKKK